MTEEELVFIIQVLKQSTDKLSLYNCMTGEYPGGVMLQRLQPDIGNAISMLERELYFLQRTQI
jgi:hypothetical protein